MSNRADETAGPEGGEMRIEELAPQDAAAEEADALRGGLFKPPTGAIATYPLNDDPTTGIIADSQPLTQVKMP